MGISRISFLIRREKEMKQRKDKNMPTIYSDGYLIIEQARSRDDILVSVDGNARTITLAEIFRIIEHLQKHVEKVENHNALEALITQSVAIHGAEKTQGFIDNLLKPLRKVEP